MNLIWFNISLLTLLLSFNAQADETLNFPSKFKLAKKSRLKHTGPNNHISGVDNNRNYTDLDQDGIIDLVDSDIDGDGALNYMDIAPLNKKKSGKDKDKDGIPDFLDFKVKNSLKEGMNEVSANLQYELWAKKDILIFNGDFHFTNGEFQSLAKLYLENELKNLPRLSNLKTIFKQPEHSMGHKAKFRNSQKNITLYQNQKHQKSSLEQILTLVHETFHAVSFEYPNLWNQFISKTGWDEAEDSYFYNGTEITFATLKTAPHKVTELIKGANFPNDYSKMGPEEMFAECATASLMMPRGNNISAKYPYIAIYRESALHQFFLNSLQTLLK